MAAPPDQIHFEWNTKRQLAVPLVAADQETDRRIAEIVGINVVTLEKWKRHPDFQAAVAECVEKLKEAMERAMLKLSVAQVAKRVERRQLRWDQIQEIVTKRGQAMKESDHPEWTHSGLVCVTYSKDLPVYALDTGLMAEERAIEVQVAKELQQWTEKIELAGKAGAPLEIINRAADSLDGKLDAFAARVAKAGVLLESDAG